MDTGTTEGDEIALRGAVAVAKAYIAGKGTPLQTGLSLLSYVDAWHPCWTALNGANGPLTALYEAKEEATRVHWLGDEVERWHLDVREQRRAELADAETRMAEPILQACKALVEYAAKFEGDVRNHSK